MKNNYIFNWPPKINELGDIVKQYIDLDNPLSIPDDGGIYKDLESEFARLHNRKYALVVSSGTMAIYSAFFGINILPGDEIISTSYSYHATISPALHLGAAIVFCDVEEDTGNIDCNKIEELITSKTKAIISNDQWGHPCDKERILEICKKYSIKYIEDCSHAHFAQYKGIYTGSFGDVACWSLQGNKLLSGGEGGILLTDNQDIYERAVLLGHNLKRPSKSVKNEYYKPLERTGYGLKLRMHPLASLVAYYQLKNYCFNWINSREKTLKYFEEKLEKETFFSKMEKKDYVTSMGAWYGFKPLADFEKLGIDRKHFVSWMKERGFQVDIPKSEVIPNYKLFTDNKFSINNFDKKPLKNEFINAQKYYEKIVSFPTFTFEEYDIIDNYINAIKKYWEMVNSDNI
ncbi:MAG: aminotransferase class I/II-fold pyridoxal phosphate-dependent enzyme [Cetobacterium sp.]